jgi:hypothetical protein
MEDTTLLNKVDLTAERNKKYPEIEKLVAECGKTFYRYMNWQGLITDPNILVLSSKHNYYCDRDELKYTTTLIIQKRLNLIKYIDSFLHILHFALTPGANFIGYFSDSNTQNRTGFISMLNREFTNFLDSGIDRKLDSDKVSNIFESHGFKVINMTVINGLTYLRTQNSGR